VRVLLVDDQQLARAGLRMILCPEEGFEVVGECADGAEVPAAVADVRPDVVVMDVRMPRVDGAEATRRLRAAPDAPPVLVLTTFRDEEVLSAALRAGASGFLLKDAPGEEILRATRAVAAGDAYLDPAVTARVLATYREAPAPSERPGAGAGSAAGGAGAAGGELGDLTARELEVLRLIARGLTNDEIAAALVIGEGTVKTHVGRIFDKLDLRDRAAAIIFAYDHGLARSAS
jgi:DNA-binding NarL/FixJ family response regulator